MDVLENDLDNDIEDVELDDQLDDDAGDPDDGAEFEISIGSEEDLTDEEKAEKELDALPPIKEFRKAFKETQRKNRELAAELEALRQPITNQHNPDVIEKPTLESCGYDTEAHEAALVNWVIHQQTIAQQIQQEEQRVIDAQKGWTGLVDSYKGQKAALKVKDFDDAESELISVIDPERQGIILKFAKEPAKLIYALGKNKSKLETLAKITDPIQFALQMNEIERSITVTKRTAPEPERRLNLGTGSGAAVISGKTDVKLERLRVEAQKTGDFTKVAAYKRALQK